jgi:hypothetical protein
MWIKKRCQECGNVDVQDIEIILDAFINAGTSTIEAVTNIKDLRLKNTMRLIDLFEEVKTILYKEFGPEISIEELRSELLHKYRFSSDLAEAFIEDIKAYGGFYETDGTLIMTTFK